MRGRKPKPTAKKVLEGNAGKRPLNHAEPVLPAGQDLHAPPAELSDDVRAAAEWRRLAPMLRASRVITDGDIAVLIAVCQQWSRYVEANAAIAKAGMVVRSPSGYPMPNPYIAISNKALGNCVKLWAELGLTPSARSRVTALPSGAGDEFAAFDTPLQSASAIN